MKDTQREAETQAEGEAGFMQGARCGTRSQDPGIGSPPGTPLREPFLPLSMSLPLSVCLS